MDMLSPPLASVLSKPTHHRVCEPLAFKSTGGFQGGSSKGFAQVFYFQDLAAFAIQLLSLKFSRSYLNEGLLYTGQEDKSNGYSK